MSVVINVNNWLEAARMLAGAKMYRDYYATDLEPDELTEFDAIVTKFEEAQSALPEPPAESLTEWRKRIKSEKSTHFRESTTPPLSLIGDTLGGCFGQKEMEMAVTEIVRRCAEAGHWNVSLDRTMFVNVDPTNYTLDGFDELIEYGWLIKGYGDHWLITEALVARLVEKRARHFTNGEAEQETS